MQKTCYLHLKIKMAGNEVNYVNCYDIILT